VGTATNGKRQLYDFDAFCALVGEDDKADLIDGVIYVASPENVEHYQIEVWLIRLLEDYRELAGIGGAVFGIKIAFRLDAKNSPEPDVAFVRGERLHVVKSGHVDGPPDWVVEVISPDSKKRDYHRKHALYERFGVREYWIIDPLQQSMTCHRLGRDGRYKEVRPHRGIVRSQVIPGFWVRPTWFWQTPLPSKNEILREILTAAANKQ
jgi:Uma2 family endonuclease